MSEAYTADEAREQFMQSVKAAVDYWQRLDAPLNDRISGVAHSILCLIDGVSGDNMPSMDLVLRPHPDDKEFHIEEGEDYYEDGMVINDNVMLHELLYT